MSQRWLILTSSTGSGHDVRAYALRDWVEKLRGDEIKVDVWHALEDSSLLGRFGVWIYNTIQRHGPGLHQVYWHIAEIWGWLQNFGTPFGGAAVEKRFHEYAPTLVISMHDSLNRPYFARARTALGSDKVRCVTYCGEWSPGFGFSRHWVDPEVDLFVSRTAEVATSATQSGVPAKRTFVFRDLLRPGDFESRMNWEDRGRYRAEVLGLAPDCFTLLLASGMKGADRHRNMLDAVAELKGRVQVIVLCGRNERTKEATLRWAEAHPEVRVSVHGFTSEVGPLFQSADVVLTRGGSNTMAECVHFAVPALFHAERGAMPQEYCTRRFLTNRNIGFTLRSQRELKVVLQRWLDNPSEYAACIQKLSTLEGPKHPSILVDRLVDLGKEVS